MRQMSCARIKRPGMRFGSQPAPREGSKIRALYDAFMLHPATPVRPFDHVGWTNSGVSTAIIQLTDFYGLDIRYYRRGTYWLVGHYGEDGRYVDFIAHRVPDPMVAA